MLSYCLCQALQNKGISFINSNTQNFMTPAILIIDIHFILWMKPFRCGSIYISDVAKSCHFMFSLFSTCVISFLSSVTFQFFLLTLRFPCWPLGFQVISQFPLSTHFLLSSRITAAVCDRAVQVEPARVYRRRTNATHMGGPH